MEQLEGGLTIYGPSATLAIWNMGLKFITTSSSAFWIYAKCGRGAQNQTEQN